MVLGIINGKRKFDYINTMNNFLELTTSTILCTSYLKVEKKRNGIG